MRCRKVSMRKGSCSLRKQCNKRIWIYREWSVTSKMVKMDKKKLLFSKSWRRKGLNWLLTIKAIWSWLMNYSPKILNSKANKQLIKSFRIKVQSKELYLTKQLLKMINWGKVLMKRMKKKVCRIKLGRWVRLTMDRLFKHCIHSPIKWWILNQVWYWMKVANSMEA